MWNVIAGVVASVVFLAFVQPILTLLWEILSSTSISVINTLVDLQYKNAALGQREWVVVFLAMLAIGVISGAMFTVLLLTTQTRDHSRVKLIEGTIQTFLTFRVTRVLLAVLLLLSAPYVAISIFTDLQLNTSFNQRLTVLTPHITEHDAQVLRAEWASMNGRVDHKAITLKMEALAASAHVKLPAPLLED